MIAAKIDVKGCEAKACQDEVGDASCVWERVEMRKWIDLEKEDDE